MSWLDHTPIDELTAIIPELQDVSLNNISKLDSVLDQIREIKATKRFIQKSNVDYKPEFDEITGMAISGQDKIIECKDYKVESVVKFDRARERYWSHVNKEVRALLCTKNEKYKEMRTKLDAVGEKGNQAVVAVIAAAIGQSLGVAAGAVSGFIAIAIKIGVNAYCSFSSSARSLRPGQRPKIPRESSQRTTKTKNNGVRDN